MAGNISTLPSFNVENSQSAPIAFIASAYMIVMIAVFLFPPIPNPTPQSMNYTVVVVGGTFVLSVGFYFFPKYGGVNWFTGPVETVEKRELKNLRRSLSRT
jgi:hypothetical protein